jgi:hypothetical protein
MKLVAQLECELFPRELETAAKFLECPGHWIKGVLIRHTAEVEIQGEE